MDLGQVLRMADKHEEAAREGAEALALYEQKGNLVSAAAARTFLADGLGARPEARR